MRCISLKGYNVEKMKKVEYFYHVRLNGITKYEITEFTPSYVKYSNGSKLRKHCYETLEMAEVKFAKLIKQFLIDNNLPNNFGEIITNIQKTHAEYFI